ncbi:MAG: transcriptional regulator [Magnetovibrio sp.]|nr:transcriptional regulator [Magnetovibrio sp.]
MAVPLPLMTIGALSRRTGCKVETIRYYERIGLLPAPARGRGGHRHYDEGALKRLDFVLRARGLGFPLDSIRGLLDLADGGGRSCAQVERIAARHLKDVRNKLADILVMEKVLAEMVADCRGGTMPDCPLIEALFNED